jgi:S1-C subfamily serine protease
VSNARRVEVVVPGAPDDGGGVRSLAKGRGRTVDAKIVGVAREIDLVLLEIDGIDGAALPALPNADYDGRDRRWPSEGRSRASRYGADDRRQRSMASTDRR